MNNLNFYNWNKATYQSKQDPTFCTGQERKTCLTCGNDMTLKPEITDVEFCEYCTEAKEQGLTIDEYFKQLNKVTFNDIKKARENFYLQDMEEQKKNFFKELEKIINKK